MKIPVLITLILVLSYNSSLAVKWGGKCVAMDTNSRKATATDTIESNTEIIEMFVDSVHIGDKGNCKIELIKHRVFEDVYVIVKFYTKGPNYWYLKNTYLYECNTYLGLKPNISDFNNDKFNDLTFISATAARGSNEIRSLFVYDDYKKEIVSIVNAEEYPNIRYNKELNCIDAFMFHGGCTTVFARIEGDRLKDFARVENGDWRTVYEVDKSGKDKLLRKEEISNPDDIYVRYCNYKPLKECKE